MSNIRIDKSKAVKKWSPVLENMGVANDRVNGCQKWLSITQSMRTLTLTLLT